MAMLWGEITYHSNKNDNENENENENENGNENENENGNNPIINDHKQTIYIKFFSFLCYN